MTARNRSKADEATPAPANDAANTKSGHHTVVLNPDHAEQTWKAQSPRWPAVALQDVTLPRRNVEYTVVRVMQMARDAMSEPRRALFLAMPGIDRALVESVAPTAEALWYARLRYRQADAGQTRAQLPARLVTDAKALRDRMWTCADYNLGHLTRARTELDDIARVEGSFYLDLAMDLQRLATAYDDPEWRPELALDQRRYDAADADKARRTAAEMLTSLANTEDATAYWTREIVRGWTALEVAWRELCAAGRWIDRHDDPAARWPELNAIVRARSATTREADTPDAPTPVEKPPTG